MYLLQILANSSVDRSLRKYPAEADSVLGSYRSRIQDYASNSQISVSCPDEFTLQLSSVGTYVSVHDEAPVDFELHSPQIRHTLNHLRYSASDARCVSKSACRPFLALNCSIYLLYLVRHQRALLPDISYVSILEL